MRNPTLLQCFHWYYPEGGKLWPELAERADGFNDIGINMVWLPPAYKGASGGYSVGYDSYDLFDLGMYIITYLFYQLLSPSNLPAISLQSVVEYPN